VINPEAVLDEYDNELYPGPGEVFTLDNTYNNQYGADTWWAHVNLQFQTSPKKFGTHSLEHDGSTGALSTQRDLTPKQPQGMSYWYYSGAMDGIDNGQSYWQFGWDGAATTYDSYLALWLDHPTENGVVIAWHDDYDSETDKSAVLQVLSPNTWYHVGLIWDYAVDQVIVVINDTVHTVDVYDFNELGLRDSEPMHFVWALDSNRDTAIDDVSSAKDVLVDSDVYVQHYHHNVPWSPVGASAKDVILKPADGGAVRVMDTDEYIGGAVRNVHISTSDPTAADGENGELWFVREA
jgi:hypothetical protein